MTLYLSTILYLNITILTDLLLKGFSFFLLLLQTFLLELLLLAMLGDDLLLVAYFTLTEGRGLLAVLNELILVLNESF